MARRRARACLALALACMGAGLVGAAGAADTPSPTWGWGVRADSAATFVPMSRASLDSLRAIADSARAAKPPVLVAADSAARLHLRPAIPDSLRGPAGPFEYLWVVRTSLLSPADVDRVVKEAHAQGVRGLLVQVVGRGDAYYLSDRLPRAEALPRDAFDPLDRLIRAAHAAGLEVHAWMNCMLAWSAPDLPRDPKHVVRAHPEWIARLRDGRSLARLTAAQRQRLGIEGIFLAPAHPGVRTWLAGNAAEIARRYPVDGLHLDYIRQPVVGVGWDPTTRARFALQSGVDPERFDRVPPAQRARLDSMWMAFQCEQVRAAVAEVRDSLRLVRPGLPLTAAVIADTITAERHNAQRWRDWLRTGLLDRAFAMCYAPTVQTVMDQLLGYAISFGAGEKIVPGISVYNTGPNAAAAKMKGARALGFPLLALYSYDALAEKPGYWERLRDLLAESGNRSTPSGSPSAPAR